MKKLILIAFSCIFFMGTIHGSKNDNAGVSGVVPVHESRYKNLRNLFLSTLNQDLEIHLCFLLRRKYNALP